MHPIFQEYEERLHRLRRTPGAVKNYRLAIGHWEAYLDERGIRTQDAQSWDVEEWLLGLAIRPSTAMNWHAQLRAAYRYAQRRGRVSHVPTYDVQFPRIPDSEPRILDVSTLRRIQETCVSSRQWTLFLLYTYSGLRRGEGRALLWEDVDLAQATIRVVGKGGKLRNVPIHPRLGELLGSIPRNGSAVLPGPQGRPLSETALRNLLLEIAPGTGFHDFRRTVASSLFRNGVPTDTIDRILGWAPRVVRSRYYVNIADDQMQEAILRLYANDPI